MSGTFPELLRVTINNRQIMTELFDRLYSQFLRGKINRQEFRSFKESLNHLSDQELSERMESFWNEHTVYPSLEVGRKQEIQRRLRSQINPSKTSIRWSRIVAAVAVVAVLSVTAWNFSLLHELQNGNASFLAEVPAGDRVQLTLPDKSSVKLNSESSLSYAYVGGKRIVRLEGEGYFQVSKDTRHPFVVQVGSLNIEVLGTCFNVCSYKENDFVETSLIEGSVRLYDSKSPSESIILKPSQKAIYSKNNGKISFHNTDNVKETAWIQNRLVFESEKLGSVFQKIERWYGVHIELLCPEIVNDPITGSFRGEQLPYVMEALKIQYGFDYEITGNKVTINKSNQLKIK